MVFKELCCLVVVAWPSASQVEFNGVIWNSPQVISVVLDYLKCGRRFCIYNSNGCLLLFEIFKTICWLNL